MSALRLLLAALALVVVGELEGAPAAAEACPGSHLAPVCHLGERLVCRCERRRDSSAVRCAWACEVRP